MSISRMTQFLVLTVLGASICAAFYIQFQVYKSIQRVSKRSLDESLEDGRSTDISAHSRTDVDHQMAMDVSEAKVVPSNGNYYISVKNYKARLKPVQHVEQKRIEYQPAAYQIAAELARRYHAKYIIDIGCGLANNLAKLGREFHVIGIDYDVNLAKARVAHPRLNLLDVNLDKGGKCSVPLPEDVLFESVVVSADVIEHLVDPLFCYIRLLRQLSSYVAAVVVSTPDRLRMASVYAWSQTINGPPVNRHHVREWTSVELKHLFTDVGLHVVLSAWTCGKSAGCPNGFTEKRNPYVNQLMVIGNTNVRKIWADRTIPVSVKVTAFVIVYANTKQNMLDFAVRYLSKQNVQPILVMCNCNMTTTLGTATNVTVKHIKRSKEVTRVIEDTVASSSYRYGDWFIVQDAHEVITIPRVYGLQLTLGEMLQMVAYEPGGFNAVATTVFFMNTTKGHRHKLVPFKVYGKGTWGDGKIVKPKVDTLQDRVRIWRKTFYRAKFFKSRVNVTDHVITDVNFLGRRVYPFHLLSMRYHPRTDMPIPQLSDALATMYGLEAALGYIPDSRRSVLETRYPY